jgi:hypothetical protein
MVDAHPDGTTEVNGRSGAALSESRDGETAKVYEKKDDAYFGYYALLSHQAQMLQVRREDMRVLGVPKDMC